VLLSWPRSCFFEDNSLSSKSGWLKALQTTPVFRMSMVVLARFFRWRDALMIVKPEMFLKW